MIHNERSHCNGKPLLAITTEKSVQHQRLSTAKIKINTIKLIGDNTKWWKGCEEKEFLLYCWWKCKMVYPLERASKLTLVKKKKKNSPNIWPSNCTPWCLVQRNGNPHPHQKLYVTVQQNFICNTKNWKQLLTKGPSTGERLKKCGTYFSWNLTHQLKRMNYWYTQQYAWTSEHYTEWKKSQSEKITYYRFQLTNIVKWHTRHGELIKGQGLGMVEGRVGVCVLQVTDY